MRVIRSKFDLELKNEMIIVLRLEILVLLQELQKSSDAYIVLILDLVLSLLYVCNYYIYIYWFYMFVKILNYWFYTRVPLIQSLNKKVL
jgi:hypothetical protein